MIHTLLDLFTLIAVLAVLYCVRRAFRDLLAANEFQSKTIDILATRVRRLEAWKEGAKVE